MPATSRIRLAIIGAGTFARKAHAPSLAALRDRYQVVAVCSRSHTSAEQLAALLPEPVTIYDDIPSLLALEDLDAVDVVLPIPLLPQVVAQALEAGKHVISEKPIAPTVAQAQELLALHSRRPDRVWMVAENFRYEEGYAAAGRAVRDGVIGEPCMVDFSVQAPVDPDSPYHRTLWRRSGDFPGGFLLDGGVHHVAALRQVVGEIDGVMAQIAGRRADLPPADTLAAGLRFVNGAVGTYTVTYAAGSALHDNAIHVVGSRGSLRATARGLRIAHGWGEGVTVEEQRFDHPPSVLLEFQDFADAIQHGKPIRNTPREALQDLAVVEAMLTSAAQGSFQGVGRYVPAD